MTKLIPLTQGKVAVVDDCDYELVMAYKWHAYYSSSSHTWYAMTNLGKWPNRTCLLMHRLIMNTAEGQVPDHIDHDGLNNCRSNMRNCSNACNTRNRNMSKANTSGYKGAHYRARAGKYECCIMVNGVSVYLGSYATPELAGMAYDAAALKYHGEYALTNAMLRGAA